MQRRRDTFFPEVFEQHVAAQRVAGRHDRAGLSFSPELAEEISQVVGLACVITPWQPITIVAAVAKMQHRRLPAVVLRCLQQVPYVSRFGRALEAVQDHEQGILRAGPPGRHQPVDRGHVAVGQLQQFGAQLHARRGCPRQRRVDRLGVAVFQPPGGREFAGNDALLNRCFSHAPAEYLRSASAQVPDRKKAPCLRGGPAMEC